MEQDQGNLSDRRMGNSLIPGDDVYTIVGNGTGELQVGTIYCQWSNPEPLVKRFNCRWIVKGKQSIKRNGGRAWALLDFGRRQLRQ